MSERDLVFPQAGLTNGERAMLRPLAEPGGPLWKIFRSMLDYGDGLRESLVSADLLNPEEVNRARKVQAVVIAVDWTLETFKQALVDVPVGPQTEETD